jgi:choice-of-anchor B domain-containing protein
MTDERRPLPFRLIAVAAAFLLATAIATAVATGSDPREGEVSLDAPSAGWNGKNYTLGQTKVRQPCSLNVDELCDTYTLNVDIPAEHWQEHKGGVEVKIAWESSDNDFDMHIFDADGKLVDSAETFGNTGERIFIENASGRYRVEVNPYDVVQSGYQGGAHVESRAEVGDAGDQGIPTEPVSNVACENGKAGPFPCKGVDLVSFLPLDAIGGGQANDIWGWEDPETGKEYALVGKTSGVAFVDISTPDAPRYLGDLPSHQPVETIFNVWRDLKVYKDHVYVVSEEPLHGMQVFDLTKLRGATEAKTWSADAHYPLVTNSHNIAINEDSGFAYIIGTSTCRGGSHIVDIREPKSPTFAGCVSEDGYTHDNQCVNYEGPDERFAGREICFDSNEDTLTIVDVTDKLAPKQLSRTPYDGATYTHQGWLTEDGRHFLVNDELDEQASGRGTTTRIFDVSKLDAPKLTGEYEAAVKAIDHNLYIRDGKTYESNYRSGLRILDNSQVAEGKLSEIGFFDVYPADDEAEFNGTWSNYPFYRSGLIAVSGIEQGLFVLREQAPAGEEPVDGGGKGKKGKGKGPKKDR